MKIVVILNGPPNSGKDTIAEALEAEGYSHIRFKDALYRDTAKLFDMPLAQFIALASNRYTKEVPHAGLSMYSPREALIYCSESVMKELYGKDYYGRQLAERVASTDNDAFIVSDGGFEEELAPVKRLADTKVVVVRLLRSGCSFQGDSRKYLDKYDAKVINDFSVSDAVNTIKEVAHAVRSRS